MILNSTLVVQIIHFLIAYWILRLFYYHPVLKVIADQDNVLEKLHATIAHTNAQIEEERTRKEQDWQNIQSYFLKRRPDLAYPSAYHPSIPALIPKFLSDDALNKLRKQVTTSLINMMDHDV